MKYSTHRLLVLGYIFRTSRLGSKKRCGKREIICTMNSTGHDFVVMLLHLRYKHINKGDCFISTDRGFPLPPALLSTTFSLGFPPLHPTPQWWGGWWRWALWWRRGGREGQAEHQGSLWPGCRARRWQEDATSRVWKLTVAMRAAGTIQNTASAGCKKHPQSVVKGKNTGKNPLQSFM